MLKTGFEPATMGWLKVKRQLLIQPFGPRFVYYKHLQIVSMYVTAQRLPEKRLDGDEVRILTEINSCTTKLPSIPFVNRRTTFANRHVLYNHGKISSCCHLRSSQPSLHHGWLHHPPLLPLQIIPTIHNLLQQQH